MYILIYLSLVAFSHARQPLIADMDVGATPEDLVRMTRPITTCTAKLVGALSSGKWQNVCGE